MVSDSQGSCGVAGGRPMDVEPIVQPVTVQRRLSELLTKVDAWDLGLVQITNEGGIESRLRRDIEYPEQAPAAFVFAVDRVAERNINHQKPRTGLGYNAGKLVIEIQCTADFRVCRIEGNWRGDFASSSQHAARARIEVRPQHPSVKHSREFFEPLAPPLDSISLKRDEIAIIVNSCKRLSIFFVHHRSMHKLNHKIGRIVLTHMLEPG